MSSRVNVVSANHQELRGGRHRQQTTDHEDAIGDRIENLADVRDWCQRRATKPSIQSSLRVRPEATRATAR